MISEKLFSKYRRKMKLGQYILGLKDKLIEEEWTGIWSFDLI